MPKRATPLHYTVWYGRFKHLAESLDGKGAADTLRAVHKMINSAMGYRSRTTAAAAHDSVELIIKEMGLNGSRPMLDTRLANITASAYGKSISVAELLNKASNEDLAELFSSVYEGLLQEGILE